ncbi:MAG: hypothetical protein KME31_26185 [Tolypothrix carrinoi HA7290-LM1]|nr:hypothetical protein [Tolypothrix carrinoi HA7290-LM1]
MVLQKTKRQGDKEDKEDKGEQGDFLPFPLSPFPFSPVKRFIHQSWAEDTSER